jgi:hypothetical protein
MAGQTSERLEPTEPLANGSPSPVLSLPWPGAGGGERALTERPRLCKVALVLQQAGNIAEDPCSFGMLWAEHFLADGELRSNRGAYRKPKTASGRLRIGPWLHR